MWPDANGAVPTGESSGFDAPDVDPRHCGTDSLDQMEAEHGSLPDTIEQITGSGGRHILFRHHDGVGNKIALAPGLDVRGEGGYMIVPPSRHANATNYEWEMIRNLWPCHRRRHIHRALIRAQQHRYHSEHPLLLEVLPRTTRPCFVETAAVHHRHIPPSPTDTIGLKNIMISSAPIILAIVDLMVVSEFDENNAIIVERNPKNVEFML